MVELSRKSSVSDVAGAGFRLSLFLNAVGAEMEASHLEIQNVAKQISLYSLILKQIGREINDRHTVASYCAVETTKAISRQSQTVFSEFKEMVQTSQERDDKGNIKSLAVAQGATWYSKKQKVNYLLGQLEALKLSLALMLQTLQLGKSMANQHNRSGDRLTEQMMLQERAEIQNMVVVQHWALVELRRLYQMAESETASAAESPPPSREGNIRGTGDSSLQLHPSELEDTSQAVVKRQETPLRQLDASIDKALYHPNKLIQAANGDIVDLLLDEWTRLRQMEKQGGEKASRYNSHYETDTEDDSTYEFERSEQVGGKYIEGPVSSARKVKNVHFRARVESGTDESDREQSKRKPPKRHILRSDDEDTSSMSSSDSEFAPSSSSRRGSGSSATARATASQESQPKHRNFHPAESPNQVTFADGQAARSSGPAGPSQPNQSRPRSIPRPIFQGPPSMQAPPPNLGLRPPLPSPNVPPSPQRSLSGGFYAPPPPAGFGGPSPQGRPYYPPPPPTTSTPYRPQQGMQRSRSKPSKANRAESRGESRGSRSKENVKRGLLGAGAVAGLMDILEGLSGI